MNYIMYVSNFVSKDKIYFQQETIMHMKKLAKSNISKMPGAKTSKITTNMIIYIIYLYGVRC